MTLSGHEEQAVFSVAWSPDGRFLVTQNPKPEARNPKPETRNPKPGTWDLEPESRLAPKRLLPGVAASQPGTPETQKPTPETLNPKPGFRNLKPEIRDPRRKGSARALKTQKDTVCD